MQWICTEVDNKIQNLQKDGSTGCDDIPVWLLKPTADVMASPLTHKINFFIEKNCFQQSRKIGKVTPFPKIDISTWPENYKLITIYLAPSKNLGKRLCKQVVNYVQKMMIYKNTMSGFWQNHSTIILLVKLKNDIVKAMGKAEVILAVMANFSKAFDSIDHCKVIKKLQSLGFLKKFLFLLQNYLSDRQRCIQVNDIKLSLFSINFGGPQWSVGLYDTLGTVPATNALLQYAENAFSCDYAKVN